ncbi:hypothetical protein GCM10025865_11860 [Paraoerskovia sediminicola]|uniref:N-acylglucosamine 2-epimerase n=1 Tax=Paraoerskovia sediminicola TaxID=1138587 RepID=A0ABM8G1H9_9CELL|nr:AGE family epimerase/isomerase [Paraoerskovia sediminicola]BDZ41887.1 hypothetical protein GCM10025865_11860 [Paraoerskovia sediminicola]
MEPWPASPEHRAWLVAERGRLLAFGRRTALPAGGAVWLDDHGAPDLSRGVQTWITARTVHTYGLGAMLGVPGSAPIARGALAGLTGILRDTEHGGWFGQVEPDGTPVDTSKQAYQHAFVMLAASTATAAGFPGVASCSTTRPRRSWRSSGTTRRG